MDVLKVSFAVQSLSDSVANIANAAFQAGITVAALPGLNAQYWLEKDTNGNTHLCTTKTDQLPLDAAFVSTNGTYTLRAVNFETLGLVGGRPEHRPHAY